MEPFNLFSSLPIVVIGVFVLVFGMILISVAKGIGEWTYNNSQPVQTVPARVTSKRAELRGRMNRGHRLITDYYATFEMEHGERAEFYVGDQEFGLLAEGDQGQLTYQGTRYHGFRRDI